MSGNRNCETGTIAMVGIGILMLLVWYVLV